MVPSLHFMAIAQLCGQRERRALRTPAPGLGVIGSGPAAQCPRKVRARVRSCEAPRALTAVWILLEARHQLDSGRRRDSCRSGKSRLPRSGSRSSSSRASLNGSMRVSRVKHTAGMKVDGSYIVLIWPDRRRKQHTFPALALADGWVEGRKEVWSSQNIHKQLVEFFMQNKKHH